MLTILLVDDDQNLTRALSIRLRSVGYDVLVANDGALGAQIAKRQPVDLILLDVDMPGYSGLELHECLNNSDLTRNIPIIYLSGTGSHGAEVEAMRLGAKAFVQKPYDWVRLQGLLRETLNITASPTALVNTAG